MESGMGLGLPQRSEVPELELSKEKSPAVEPSAMTKRVALGQESIL